MPASSQSAVRNRAPCLNCQKARRKCDSKKPSCTRCIQKGLVCCPSKQARWRMVGSSGFGPKAHSEQGSEPSPFSSTGMTLDFGNSSTPGASPVPPPSLDEPIHSLDPPGGLQPAPAAATTGAGSVPPVAAFQDVFRLDADSQFDFSDLSSNLPPQGGSSRLHHEVNHPNSNNQGFPRFDLAPVMSWYTPLKTDANVSSSSTSSVDMVSINSQALFDKNRPLSPSALLPPADTEFRQFHTSLGELPNSGPNGSGSGIRIEHEQTDHVWFPLLLTPSSRLPANSLQDPILAFVWKTYTTKIVTDLTYFGLTPHNPFMKHLARCAAHEPALFSAVSYWSMAMIRSSMPSFPWNLSSQPSDRSEESKWQHLFESLEDNAVEGLKLLCVENEQAGKESWVNRTDQLLAELCTMATLTNAYITLGKAEKAILHLESGLVLAKALWKRFHTDALYIFIVTWLGGMHTSAMLCEGTYTVSAPDYVEFAAQSEQTYDIVDPPAASQAEQILTLSLPAPGSTPRPADLQSALFPDILNFTGLSRGLSATLYKTGCLYKASTGQGCEWKRRSRRQRNFNPSSDGNHAEEVASGGGGGGGDGGSRDGSSSNNNNNNNEDDDDAPTGFWTAYATEIDELEMRLYQETDRIDRLRGYGIVPGSLDHYNLAFLYTAQLIFLTDITSWPQQDEKAIEKTIDMILDSCASLPLDSPVSKFVILAYFHAGIRSRRPMQQAFVRDRLQRLKNCYVSTNIPQVLELLEAVWTGSQSRYEKAIDGSSGMKVCLVF